MPINAFIKKILPKSLLGRSILIIVSPLVLLQVVSTILFFESHWDKITRRLAAGVAGDIAAVIDLMNYAPSQTHYDWIQQLASSKMGLEINYKEKGVLEKVTLNASGAMEGALLQALRDIVRKPVQIRTQMLDKRVVIDVQLSGGVLEVIAQSKRLFSSTIYVFVIWMVGTSLILFAVATIFMRNQVKPIRRLATAADNFGKGRDTFTFKPEGAAEVRQAAQAFIVMKERIQRQIGQRTDMLAGVSHDLRTPLTRMKLQIALLQNKDDVQELSDDIDEMEYLLDEYIAFARGEGTEKHTTINLNALLKDATKPVLRKTRKIDVHLEEEIIASLRPNAFKRCITNLIENGLKYGQYVSVRAGIRSGVIEIVIDDDGPGIPEEKREEVFKPFVRLEGSRNLETGGVGLGLSIARDVIRGHGGDLLLDASPMNGLRAIVRLPL